MSMHVRPMVSPIPFLPVHSLSFSPWQMQNKTSFPRSFCESLRNDFFVHRSFGVSIPSTMGIIRLRVLRGTLFKAREGIARLYTIQPECGLLDGEVMRSSGRGRRRISVRLAYPIEDATTPNK